MFNCPTVNQPSTPYLVPYYAVDSLLQPFKHFGVNLGLARIVKLLETLNNPHRQVPIIHVAGTNGKGSVCAYLSSILTESGYKTGRYTSPHLIEWNERICINEKPIASEELTKLIERVKAVINSNEEQPTQFEIITAASWLYFAQEKVDIAVVEVGLGGRLDATNVCDHPLVTVITSIGRDHWQQLGSSISDIAREKAGIIKAGCPVVMGKLPEDAKRAVICRSVELESPIVVVSPAREISPGWAEYQTVEPGGHIKAIKYPLPLKGQIQLTNSALALASLGMLQRQGWEISGQAIIRGMEKTKWPGRMQWFNWKNRQLLIDGAHNPESAQVLRNYVDSIGDRSKNITWVMGMLTTKDHKDIFRELLKTKDRLYLVPVPGSDYANLDYLKDLALETCPDLDFCAIYEDIFLALNAAFNNFNNTNINGPVVLCGSLYLIGHFFSQVNLAK
ncbi:bifunctional folylpolyglutamate synthase/dihydrofolate synthase [Cylindrospermopsis raciborskii MVCC19]|uniref:Dihydrofolate synthase/folylpolyglutamate synthase n=1 Tax=Cylindrospermopsis raciborskii CENA302 TaxID=1170768 RepID=A0A9Q5QYD1_9CYAN|nr:bifunctional folylpolyglutamate synthase/dihydrofolate synthase [Cylindrospermopsis raciborskii MVCC19]OHY31440.1 bifunctional folylpolyglutamate synthase/dihydrofolate synthase [Cylindrospermopsis raciborskii MVCC14]OPH10384.1 bifunctional folylpolyglutamate synthase/dihydrofolate synthase [Cylindrospermopsis raciborskii CENA302]